MSAELPAAALDMAREMYVPSDQPTAAAAIALLGDDGADKGLRARAARELERLRERPRPTSMLQGLCPRHRRDSCTDPACLPVVDAESSSATRPGPRFEALPEFLARVGDAGPRFFVRELLPEGIAVWHGRPRSMKSLAALEAVLALVTGTPAFGDPRFAVSEPVDVLLLTEEDSERTLSFRLRLMLAGRKLLEVPRRLHVVSRPGWSLESRDDQEAMLAAVRAVPDAKVLCIDPARGSLPSIDKGPADAAQAVRFLRRLMRETSIDCLLLVHHDTKPLAQGKDERQKAERASGGVTFSIADAPVAFERLNDRASFVHPCAFKHGADPKPFRVEFESATPAGEGFRDYLRAVATTSSETTEQATKAEPAILRMLEAEPGVWFKADKLVTCNRQAAVDALKHLRETGAVAFRKAGKGFEYSSSSNGSVSVPEPIPAVLPGPPVGGPGTAGVDPSKPVSSSGTAGAVL